jgi:predicted RNA polymerase sigma factor
VAERTARDRVGRAKTALGERGTPWWEQTPQERRARWSAGLDAAGPDG